MRVWNGTQWVFVYGGNEVIVYDANLNPQSGRIMVRTMNWNGTQYWAEAGAEVG